MGDHKIKVRLDRDVKDLIPGYLANREKDIKTIRESLEKKDFTKIATLGHWMKGAGAGYGFEGISEIGQRMEKAAETQASAEIESLVRELEQYLKNVEIIYV